MYFTPYFSCVCTSALCASATSFAFVPSGAFLWTSMNSGIDRSFRSGAPPGGERVLTDERVRWLSGVAQDRQVCRVVVATSRGLLRCRQLLPEEPSELVRCLDHRPVSDLWHR